MHLKPTIRKVPADSVPYGMEVSTNGRWVWAVYNRKDERIGIAATKKEARIVELKALGVYGRAPAMLPSELEGRRDLAHKLRPGEKV